MSAFRFEYVEPHHQPVLKIALNKDAPAVQINRASARSYTIVIPGSTVATAGLRLPHYPPADFIGFESVEARSLDGAEEVTIHVESGTRLSIFVRRNEIWVQRL